MLPVHPEVVLQELVSAKDILAKWVDKVASGNIPMIDLPSDEEALSDFLRNLCGELLLVAGKCSTLAEVLYGSRE